MRRTLDCYKDIVRTHPEMTDEELEEYIEKLKEEAKNLTEWEDL